MKQEKHVKALLGVTAVFIVILVSISGCTSNQNTNAMSMQLSGTWVGNVQMTQFGKTGNATVSKITFSGNTVELTVNTEQGAFTTNYTYFINGSSLVFEPQFNRRSGFPGGQPYNGTRPGNWTRPPTNETWPINGTRPDNGTRPSNWTRSENGTWNPGGGRPSLSISLAYSLNEEHTVLYLNNAAFNKVQ